MVDNEIWKPILNFEEKYMVSNFGNIFSNHLKRNLKLQTNKYGYQYCQLSISKGNLKYQLIHRLVAEHFIDNPDDKPQVNHIDGNKQNNNAENLEWVTSKENTLHAYELGLRNNDIIINNGLKKAKRIYQLDMNTMEIIKEWDSINQIVRETGYDGRAISSCCKLIKLSHKGFAWRYEHNLHSRKASRFYKIEVYENNNFIGEFNSAEDLANHYSVRKGSVYRALNEDRKFLRKYKLTKKYIEY